MPWGTKGCQRKRQPFSLVWTTVILQDSATKQADAWCIERNFWIVWNTDLSWAHRLFLFVLSLTWKQNYATIAFILMWHLESNVDVLKYWLQGDFVLSIYLELYKNMQPLASLPTWDRWEQMREPNNSCSLTDLVNTGLQIFKKG